MPARGSAEHARAGAAAGRGGAGRRLAASLLDGDVPRTIESGRGAASACRSEMVTTLLGKTMPRERWREEDRGMGKWKRLSVSTAGFLETGA